MYVCTYRYVFILSPMALSGAVTCLACAVQVMCQKKSSLHSFINVWLVAQQTHAAVPTLGTPARCSGKYNY